jgi:S1-C subfamily serine protease
LLVVAMTPAHCSIINPKGQGLFDRVLLMKQHAIALAALLVLFTFFTVDALAGKVYIWRDSEGKAHFSDQPPQAEEASGEVEERKFKEPPPPPPVEESAPVAGNPIEHAVNCTFRLTNKKGGASGFFINDKGLAVTAKHVVEDATYSMKAELPGDKRKYSVRILKKSREHDLALLQVGVDRATPYLEIRDPNTLVRGEDLWAIGNPLLAFRETITKGNFSRMFPEADWKKEAKLKKPPFRFRGDQVQFSTPVIPGNSGGPVVDNDGRVIGVVSFGYPNTPINFAAPSSYIKKDFESYLK